MDDVRTDLVEILRSRIEGRLLLSRDEKTRLGRIGRSTIRRILKRNGIPPAPRRARDSNWREFISTHMHNTVAAGSFTVEVVTPYALVTFYVLFFIHHATRRALIAGVTTNPDTPWMMQIASPGNGESAGKTWDAR